jgi:catechol 2,3-dioxygenase-like lactoylglutathione lyase family enzyme
MVVPPRISLVTFGTLDMSAQRAFYRALGWAENTRSTDEYAIFQTAGVMLTLFPLEALNKDAELPAGTLQSGLAAISLAINVDHPDGVDDTVATAQTAGAKILREPGDAFWGGRTAYFADPENHLWEVAWNPTATFDDRGAMIDF